METALLEVKPPTELPEVILVPLERIIAIPEKDVSAAAFARILERYANAIVPLDSRAKVHIVNPRKLSYRVVVSGASVTSKFYDYNTDTNGFIARVVQ
jgi:hypothetical protein